MAQNKLEDFVLYNGSLEELNSRSSEQYKFADELHVLEEFRCGIPDDGINEAKKILKKKGYNGLVNARISTQNAFEGYTVLYVTVEGTPILREPLGPSKF